MGENHKINLYFSTHFLLFIKIERIFIFLHTIFFFLSKIKSIHDFFPQRQLLPSFHKKQIKFDEVQLGANEIS